MGANVVILGQTVVNQVFPAGEDPIGKTIRVGPLSFLVDGVMAVKGANR